MTAPEPSMTADEVAAIVDARIAERDKANQPKPTASDHLPTPQGWPPLGETFRATLEAACDLLERDGDIVGAVQWFYTRERQDRQLAAELHAWRHDEHGERRHWAMPIVENGIIRGLIESTHLRRDRARGRHVSNLPDAALALIEEIR